MDELKAEIIRLEEVTSELDPSESLRKEYAKQIYYYSEEFLGSLNNARTYSTKRVKNDSFLVNGEKEALEQLIEIYSEQVAETGIRPASGGHLGFIPGGGLYSSALADFLVDITNEYAGIRFSSPGGVAMEDALIDWLKSIFRFPKSAVGNLASGGSIATMTAFTAARDRHKIKAERIKSSVVYLSRQVHHCVNKALRIIGLEDLVVRYVELDENHRVIVEKLNSQIEADKREGLNPFMVVASAGTTDTGAIDPLEAIGEITSANEIWYHIDAAYGGFFILCKEKKELFDGIETADSLIVDPHKGLFLPFGIGAVLVKDVEAVFQSHHETASYMQDAVNDEKLMNPADVSPELTKHFRGFRMWLPLKLHGLKPFVACLREKLLLTEYFRRRLVEIGFEVGPAPDLSVSYFWYPSEIGENDFNKSLLKLIHEDGRVFLSSTKIGERFVIRMAILSFRTKLETIDKAIDMIDQARKKLESGGGNASKP